MPEYELTWRFTMSSDEAAQAMADSVRSIIKMTGDSMEIRLTKVIKQELPDETPVAQPVVLLFLSLTDHDPAFAAKPDHNHSPWS